MKSSCGVFLWLTDLSGFVAAGDVDWVEKSCVLDSRGRANFFGGI